VKGAVLRVLGPRRVAEAGAARLTFQTDDEPRPEEVAEILKGANLKIEEDAEFIEFEMEREEAEGHFGKGIYGFPSVRGGGILLRMVSIPEWEASSCARRHVQSTGEVGPLEFEHVHFDDSKKMLEVQLRLLR
jgi:Ser-tRNA(Ala) deacylase AlaX